MSFMEKAQNWFRSLIKPANQGGDPSYTQRADGSMSGYHPNARQTVRQAPVQEQAPVQPVQSAADAWPQATGFTAQIPVMPLQSQQPVQPQAAEPWQSGGMVQGNGVYGQQPWEGYQQPQQDLQQTWYQPSMQGGFAPTWQNPPANQPGSPFMGYQGGQQSAAQSAPQQVPDNIVYMNDMVVDKTGRGYRHSLRVAQINTIPDCYRLVEFMRGSETVLVNLDAMNEAEEMGRCLDLLYGAAYALQCTFTRVSNRSLYLITPADILVQPYDSIGEASDREIDARWPDPASVGYMQRNAGREQRYAWQDSTLGMQSFTSKQPAMNQQPAYGRFQGRAVNQSQNTGYTDFGGFGALRR